MRQFRGELLLRVEGVSPLRDAVKGEERLIDLLKKWNFEGVVGRVWGSSFGVVLGRSSPETDVLNGVEWTRRWTGGGSVVHGPGNVNVSFFFSRRSYRGELSLDAIWRTFSVYIRRTVGVEVEAGSRRELLLNGKKFSGVAFGKKGEWFLVHFSVLVEFDLEKIERVLALPPFLKDMGIERHRDYLTTLKAELGLGENEFRDKLVTELLRDGFVFVEPEDFPLTGGSGEGPFRQGEERRSS